MPRLIFSVRRFSNDNNCVFVFYANGFIVKDKCSGKILFQGLTENGLYPFHFSTTHVNKAGLVALLGECVSFSPWPPDFFNTSISHLQLWSSSRWSISHLYLCLLSTWQEQEASLLCIDHHLHQTITVGSHRCVGSSTYSFNKWFQILCSFCR